MTDFTSVSFSQAILSAAAAIGREPSVEQVSAMEAELRTLATLDAEAGTVAIGADGITVETYVTRRAATMPRSTTPQLASPIVPNPTEPAWARGRTGTLPDLARKWAASADATALRNALDGENPWLSGHENRSRQQIIKNLNPALAVEMQTKAGAA